MPCWPARIGAIHCVVFGGFSAEAIADRNNDATAKLMITADAGWRRGKHIPLKENVDLALEKSPTWRSASCAAHRQRRDYGRGPRSLVARSDGRCLGRMPGRAAGQRSPAVHPLHQRLDRQAEGRQAHHGRLQPVRKKTMEWVFDVRDEDLFWFTADIGWITGHSYVVYGPLAAGATMLMYEGRPTGPTRTAGGR